jgi:hypothetical protein
MLAAPAYAVAQLVTEPSLPLSLWLCRVASGVVPTLAFLWLLWRFLARFAPDPAIRRLVLIAYALGSMAMTYSILFYSHQLAAACAGGAWMLGIDAAERRRSPWVFVGVGALAGSAPLVDYQAAFALVPAGIHVLAKLTRWHDGKLRAVAAALGGAIVPIAILLAYHWVCFGSPWRTGYDASTTFAHHHQAGFLGITALRWDAFVGSFLKIDNGLVPLAPWPLLAIPGTLVLARGLHRPRGEHRSATRADHWRGGIELGLGVVALGVASVVALAWPQVVARPLALIVLIAPLIGGLALIIVGSTRLALSGDGNLGTAVVGIAVVAIYTVFITSINFWRGGWGVGPRYITAMLPFVLPAIAAALAAMDPRASATPTTSPGLPTRTSARTTEARTRRRRLGRIGFGVAAGAIVVGVAVYTLSAMTFPYWPDSMKHPLYDVTFRLLAHDLVAPNLGGVVGLPGVLGIVPVLALIVAVVGSTIRRIAGSGALALACVIAGCVLAGYGLLPRGGPQADRAFTFVRDAAAGAHL